MLLLLLISWSAFGLNRDRRIEQFFHTAWTVGEGAPSGLAAIAQTTDGYLWLGTQTGLMRFDGVRFESYEPTNEKFPSNDISALMPAPDGGLWVGFAPFGAAFLKNGRIVAYGQRDGLPSSPVYAFGRDGEGTLWLGTVRGLRRFDGSRWQTIGSSWGFPDERADSFFLDHQGTLWVSTLDGLFSLPLHARSFQVRRTVKTLQLGETIRSPRVAETKAGAFWVTKYRDVLEPFARPPERLDPRSASAIEPEVRQILVDRDNTMWVFTYADGIARIKNPEELTDTDLALKRPDIDHFTEKEGLSDNRIMAALEDREGNIWVATRSGLDRFRARNVVPGPFPYGSGEQDLALAVDKGGAVWAGNLDQPLMRLQNSTLSFLGKSQRITCAFRDSDGTLWFGGEGILTRLSQGRFQKVTLPQEIEPGPNWAIQAMTRDHNGDLWVSIIQNGVFRLHDGVWTHFGNVAALPRRTAIVLWTDSSGRVWFGYSFNLIAVLDGNVVRTFSDPDGLMVGSVTAIGESGDRIWAGGLSGLAIFDGKRFRTINNDFRGVSGILRLPNGDLWLNQATGVVHIPAREVAALVNDPNHHAAFDLFDVRDGVPGVASPLRPLPSEVLAKDGRIWLSGTNGTSWIDPALIYRNPLPPPVSIQSVVADGEEYSADSIAKLPVLPSNLRIDYTALSLSMPERVRFRYQLEGFDKSWQDAGTRRAAFYTKLGPGQYRFHVIACNNDGVWNMNGAAIQLIVPPAFFQTAWFLMLCISAGAGVLWMFYRLRLRQVASQMQNRLGERLAERERIARELHGTLLQGIQGLILRFQAATKQIPEGARARRMMEEALDCADEVMIEGRDRVSDLRTRVDTANALSEALSLAGQEFVRDSSRTMFRLVVDGTPRELHPLVRDEAYRIGREAIANAFYHAAAKQIEVELSYSRRELQLRFRDDGCGIDAGVLNSGVRPGHWGLIGMRERAKKIRAGLEIRSRPGAGTEIELRVPGAIAYRAKVGDRWSFRRLIEPRESD